MVTYNRSIFISENTLGLVFAEHQILNVLVLTLLYKPVEETRFFFHEISGYFSIYVQK